uniref:Midasin n=2 Tax=Wuchereria bancrofti TaxID=6293 RepID=A0A1I8EQE7_WUCBA
MKVKKTRKQKRKLLLTDEVENTKPEKMIRSRESSEENESVADFVPDTMPTRTTYREQLEVGIRNRVFVLLQGPIGCGKTSIVKEVAHSMKLPCRTIQMGEQIDSKTLFGIFHCLDVPGEFCWKQSTFTKYILDKGIILLEDIDCASADLISQIINLCDSREVRVTSGETIRMHNEAYIVATMRCIRQERSFRSADVELLLSSVPFEISLPPFSNSELHRAICILYKRVAPIAQKLITLFDEFINNSANQLNGRKLGATDLLKACTRINDVIDLSDPIAVFHELVDCWAIHCRRQEDVVACSEIIANSLSLNHDQLMYQLNLRLPEISVTQTSMRCGRVNLSRNQIAIKGESKVTCFGITRNVCQLLERIAVCVSRMEPILLVGETGVGKTAIIQLLADRIGTTLRVVNLSQHSDSSDLIGGYKPVSIPYLLRPLKKEFDELFAATFDLIKNGKFLNHLEMCLSNGRYSDYAKLIAETARRRLKMSSKHNSLKSWAKLLVRAERCAESLKASAVSFAYVRGAVAEAAERGEWLLVDEINLATPECLDSVVRLTEDPESRHPDFRLFACMNPASDVGKRNLPPGIRSRFTEIFVHETTEMEQLHIIAQAYLPSFDVAKISIVLELYQTLCIAFPGKYSLRTLCRALAFMAENVFGNDVRNMYEAVSMSFMSNLNAEAQAVVGKLIQSKMNKISLGKMNAKFIDNRIEVEGYYIEKGNAKPQDDPGYVCTASVRKNLAQLARIVCSGKFPVLLEGETSCGKTAMVIHLAKITGNMIIRINNHEHTDLQEYMGSYVPDGDGRFVFIEGPLVKAARNGHWIILDELNLAPTDIIEAFNRLLDDNRELFISETNTVVKADPRFRVFATQNPVCTYAGRKPLSRALLNRFIVLQFDQLPYSELAQMIIVSCKIAPSAAQAMVSVFCDLRAQRSAVGVFSASDGLMTLRDLFRWGQRLAGSNENDWRQCLVEHGFMLLGARCRNAVDVECVKKILEKNLKRKINIERLFASDSHYLPPEFRSCIAVNNIVLTGTIRRMLVLVSQSWHFAEPVLMIGETGCGKTTVAQMLAKEKLLALNCHERTEAADFLGSLRPVGEGAFKWIYGVVVQAMKEGRPLLIDEISLASDSVLERLNPLLEPSRSLFLNDGSSSGGEVQAKSGFNIIATMNPGGDYGKKELSKALRNRFTEIWCPSNVSGDDLTIIVDRLLSATTLLDENDLRLKVNKCIVKFVLWFDHKFSHMLRNTTTIRDIVAVTQLVIAALARSNSPCFSIYHAFSATLFDAFGTLSTRISLDCNALKKKAIDGYICRLVRGLAVDKPILLEGPPGCGKSSTVVALAAVTGHSLTRLNLSEQTDLADLFGCDVPVILSDGTPSFMWRDGPILHAIKTGQWVLLDEMNLASQSVLEGLNACFDHRHHLFIPELNRTFDIGVGDRKTRFFACQNPCSQGGNRRKLPKSYVNRFTSIYVAEMDASDFFEVIRSSFGSVLIDDIIQRMVNVNKSIANLIAEDTEFLRKGSPFEFNLRDLLRWAQLTVENNGDVAYGFDLLYVWRLRSNADRQKMRSLFYECFKFECAEAVASLSLIDPYIHIGKVEFERSGTICGRQNTKLLSSQMKLLNKLAVCVKMNWLSLIVGKAGSGKSTAVGILASLLGKELYTIHLTSESDSLELLGSFEQITDQINFTSIKQHCLNLLKRFPDLLDDVCSANDILTLRLAIQTAMLLVDDDIANKLLKYYKELGESKMRFEWLNSRFVDAFINGYWILIENVNCCSAAVLDRLNACLENNGELNLQECGDGTSVVKAHNDFRVFFTMDDDYGSVSRAMRNRSVELYLLPDDGVWFRVAQDLVNMVMNTENQDILRITPTVMQAYEQLSCWELLKLKILLKEKDTDFVNVVKHFKIIMNEEVMDTDENKEETFIVYPAVDSNFATIYSKWKILVWSYVSQHDWMLGVLWATFCIPFKHLEIVEMVELFECTDTKAKDKVIEAIQNLKQNKTLDYDERFDGSPTLRITKSPDKYIDNDRFIIGMCALWAKFNLDKILTEKGSAVDISNLFIKRKIRSDQLSSPAISHVKELLNELNVYISKFSSTDYAVSDACLILWNIVLFVKTCHQQMDLRSGCAPLHLAWQRLNDPSYSNIWKQWSTGLCSAATAIDKVWLTDKKALERYSNFHKRCSFFEPFRSYEEWRKYEDELKDLTMCSTSMANENCLTQQNIAEMEKHDANKSSVLSAALKLIKNICCGFAILNNHNEKQTLLELLSISVHHPVELCRLVWLNLTDEKWSQIAYFSQYLCSNFAVREIPTACKNSDLAWITLGTELFSSVWRPMGFQLSSQEITLAQLGDFPIQRKHLCTYLWKIGAHLKSFKLKYREKLLTLIDHFESLLDTPSFINLSSNITLSNLMQRLEITACLLLPLSVPAKNCIDPVINDEMSFNYLMNKKKLLGNIVGVLQSYQGIVSGQTDLALFSNSKHPFISILLNAHNSVVKELQNCSQNTVSFRPRHTDFPLLAITMNTFLEAIVEQHRTFSHIDLNHLDSLSDNDIQMTVAQIDSFLTSVQSFYNKTFAEYSAFMDIICPFFMFLNVLVATVSYKRFHLIQTINLRDLIATYSFPTKFSFKWNCLNNLPESGVFYKWCISQKTIMPKRLQKELVALSLQKYRKNRQCFTEPKEIMIKAVIEWIRNEWSKWFKANTEKQEKAYVYRKSTKHGEEELDEDDIKLRELLPDFSTSNDEQDLLEEPQLFASGSDTCIDSESLIEILHLLASEEYMHNYDGHMALAWMMDTALSCGLVDDFVDSKIFVYNLYALNQLDRNQDVRVVDVYRRNNRSELGKCIAAMKPLIKRVYWLKEKWPEMTILDGILQRAQKILSTSMETPQMQFSALLEQLLAEADLWEKVADRKHSLMNELEELRHLLVNWRKMEVLCWDNLLEQVQTDCRTQTLLLSWPLFEALNKVDKGDDEILAMTIEWIQNSTIIDFRARLLTAELLIKFIMLTKESMRDNLCQRLRSAVVENKLATQKEPTEKQLHDFVKIMKYNDLNLWSVKASAQKAHKQLFRLLKQFKLSSSDLVAPLLDENSPMLSTTEHQAKPTFATDRIISCNDFYAKRAVDLTSKIAKNLMDGIHLENIEELTEFVKCCNYLIRKDIQYEGNDSEKEKQQGRALSERQKAVARLLKDSIALGLSTRKGLMVNAEQLTANVVAGMPEDSTMLTKFIRYGGAARNVVLKNFHKPNAQISTKTMSELKGLTEFILNELYLCQQVITVNREMLKRMDRTKKMLLNYLENAKDVKQPCLHGQQWLHCLQQSKYSALKFNSLLEFMGTKLENAPECSTDFEENTVLKLSGIQDTRLSQLHKQHQEYDATFDAIRKMRDAAARILETIELSLLHSVDCSNIAIWKSSDISHTINIVKSESTHINSQLSLISCVMTEEVEEALEILRKVLEALTNPTSVQATTEDVQWEGIQALLIIVQNTYKQAMSINFDNIRFMDILRQLTNLLRNLNFDKSIEEIWHLCVQLSEGKRSMEYDRLEQVTSISSTLCEVLSFILEVVENSAIELAKYYIHFEAMTAALLEKGYVNPIPKPQKESSEKDGSEPQSYDDDIAGLGDAKGEKDVGDDIDETGQVEGLKGDEENTVEPDENKSDGTPLDMDDDFGGCLEDIDREQCDDNEGSDKDEDNEPETDMEVGDNETNDANMEELNKDDDEVLKGGSGGMDRGAVEDTTGSDNVLNPNDVTEDDENMRENDLAAEIEGKGKSGRGETEDDDIRNEKSEDVKEVDKESKKEKKLADDITNVVVQKTLPSGQQKDEEGPEFGHFDGNNSSLREQIVIDKSSVEEARNSKGNRDQLRDLKNISVEQNDEEMTENNSTGDKHEVDEDDLIDTDIWDSDFQSSIIHSTANFHRSMGCSNSTVTLLDTEEVGLSNADAEDRWNRISDSVSVLAAELSENLRMIIEPTVASRFEGDYRTGKRLNMRRLIAYIASGYRKDKIWLRRTKKAQHNYQILIAVDDSSSMHDNQIKLKACQSVAMIESGLRRLEIGQLAICKFGGSVKMISDFGDRGGSGLGGKLINELNFGQNRTDLVNLLNCSKKIFEQARGRERNNQMLIIVSDGRGVLADGAEAVKKAVAELHADRATVLFVAIDNGEKSIVDMKVAEFTADGKVNLIPYLQKFPFPFYVVVGHVAMLPATISDAVRQWFELTTRDS